MVVACFKVLSQKCSRENKETHEEELLNLDSLSVDQELNPVAK
jgi:hypothetical protein